jgi:hypothetical protein
MLINRQLKNIKFIINSFNFYIKQNFFSLIQLLNFKNRHFIKKFTQDLKFSKNKSLKNFIYNYCYNHNNKQVNIKFNVLMDLSGFICKNCLCLSTSMPLNKILYYQNFLKLNLLNKNIIKFKFIFCSLCNKYKLSLKDNTFIP